MAGISKARLAAGAVALVILTGLGLQLVASLDKTGGMLGAALWSMFRFFTIIGNLLALIALAAFALGARAATQRVIGGVTLMMLLIGVVYTLLLRGLEALSPIGHAATVVMHYVSPVLVVLFWVFFAPKGRLRPSDPLRWALLPLAYLPYALARGAEDGKYPYPFLDVNKFGLQQVLINALVIAIGFILAGYALLWFDQRMSRR